MTYTIYVWDCEANGWDAYERSLPLFRLRPILRSLCGQHRSWHDPLLSRRGSWSEEMVKVCRDDADVDAIYDRDAARDERQAAIECLLDLEEVEAAEFPLFAKEPV